MSKIQFTELSVDYSNIDALIRCGAKGARNLFNDEGAVVGAVCYPEPDLAGYDAAVAHVSRDLFLRELRVERNRLLAASDWTQLPDAPLQENDAGEWRMYRQALRDLTATEESDISKVRWPEPPT